MRATRPTRPRLPIASLTTILCALGFAALAQPTTPYFQQRANYALDATLDPATHLLSVTGTLTYVNHAPGPLDSIALHLWANAFASRESPFAQQRRRFGSAELAFAPDASLGGYRDLHLSGPQVGSLDYATPELAWLSLSAPLPPGDSLVVSLAYDLLIPRAISRLGRDGDAYAITQWFPKPAVYDATGWHTMPYLDAGEFFSEFGDYDVSITVPANGAVAASGELVNSPGLVARERRIALTLVDTLAVDTLAYGSGTVTYRYRSRDVHDFAWFVNPRFRIRVDTARLATQRIPAYAYYPAGANPAWREAAGYLSRATAFADSLVGPYPYPQITAVRGPLGTGGGMEYPTVTVVGATRSARTLHRVLAHEAFHNWFQGMLASDEREHAWMDEGLTSYLEGQYMARAYPGSAVPFSARLPRFLRPGGDVSLAYLVHAGLASAARAPAPDTHPDSLSGLGYEYAAYLQPKLLFDLLDDYLGGDEFASRLRAYYDAWALRHPAPADLQAALGGQQVDWLFDELLADTRLPDYRITSAERHGDSVQVVIENRGSVASPFPLAYSALDDSFRVSRWVDGFADTQTLAVAVPRDAQRIAVDPHAQTPEIARDDNYYRLGGGLSPKLEPLGLGILTHVDVGARNVVNLVPVIGLNTADQLLIGVGAHNYSVLNRGTRFYLFPQVATRDASLNGMGGLKVSLYERQSWWRELQLSAEGRAYHYDYNDTYDYNDRFTRVTIGGDLLLAADAGLPDDRRVGLRAHLVRQRFAVGENAEQRLFRRETRGYVVAEADYTHQRDGPLTPYRWRVAAQGGSGFARVSSTLHAGVRYRASEHYVRARVFAGAFLAHDDPEARALLLPNGVTGFNLDQYDYTFEQFIYDRSEQSQQIYDRDGALSLPFLLPVPGSETWLTGVTLTADAPVNLAVAHLRAYLDAALYPDSRAGASGVVAPVTGGLRVSFFDDFASISFPLINNGFVRGAIPFTIAEPNYWDRIAFRLDLRKANVDELLRRLRG